MTAPDPIASLWRAARAFFERLRAAIGEAQTIAQQRHLDQEALAQMRAWLRPLEAMVRKIVLLQAMRLARTPEPPKPQHAKLPPLKHYGPAPQAPYPQPREHKGRLRLWPRQKPHPARIRQLGPPLLVRDIYRERVRAAQADRLNMVRFMRPSEPQRIAGRIAALERVLAKPLIAARRLARKLRAAPRLALKLAIARWPRSPHADIDTQATADRHLWADALAFNPDKDTS